MELCQGEHWLRGHLEFLSKSSGCSKLLQFLEDGFDTLSQICA